MVEHYLNNFFRWLLANRKISAVKSSFRRTLIIWFNHNVIGKISCRLRLNFFRPYSLLWSRWHAKHM